MSKELLDSIDSLLDEISSRRLGVAFSKMGPRQKNDFGDYVLEELGKLHAIKGRASYGRESEHCNELTEKLLNETPEELKITIDHIVQRYIIDRKACREEGKKKTSSVIYMPIPVKKQEEPQKAHQQLKA